MTKHRLSDEQLDKWVRNMLKFTAPALAVFFLQLAGGVEFKLAGTVALLALYGVLADFFRKLGE